MWLLKAACCMLDKTIEGEKTKRRNQCKPAQKIWVSCLSEPPLHFLTDFSCCWEGKVFTWGDHLSNALRIWELPNSLLSYVLVIWKTDQTVKYLTSISCVFLSLNCTGWYCSCNIISNIVYVFLWNSQWVHGCNFTFYLLQNF